MVSNKKNRVHDDYKISGKEMGKGAFGEVVLAVQLNFFPNKIFVHKSTENSKKGYE